MTMLYSSSENDAPATRLFRGDTLSDNNYLGAVSYTHLDVYKRQLFSRQSDTDFYIVADHFSPGKGLPQI